MLSHQTTPVAPASPLDLAAIKARQRTVWSTGDYSVVGTTLQIVGEELCEAVDLLAGERVLDVATGNGNAALAAARRHAEVIGVDYVPALLENARQRALADGLRLDLREGDAEALDFPDGSFDVVLSTFGVMFTPDQERAAGELLRVCRPGGRIGLASWTPEGFIGRVFQVLGRHVPPPRGLLPASAWGTEDRLRALLGHGAADLSFERRHYVFRYASAEHWLSVFRTWYGPVQKAFAGLEPDRQAVLEQDLLELLRSADRSGGRSLVVPSEYLQLVLRRA